MGVADREGAMRYWRGVAVILVLAVAGEAAAGPVRIGTTFSDRQCRYLQIDPHKTLQETLKAKFDFIRLAAYWDDLEPQEGVYDFTSLDWQIIEAASSGTPIVLTVGMKAPRWPEFFIPSWALSRLRLRKGRDVSQEAYLRERTLRFMEAVVERYKHESMIRYWQVENEPMDRVDPEFWWIGADFVEQEVALVRRLDPQHRPILLTTVTYPNALLRNFMHLFVKHDSINESLRLGDLLGVNVYPVVGHRWFLKTSYYWTTPEERRVYLTSILKQPRRGDKPVWVTELQAEPWEPKQLVYTASPTPPTGDPALLANTIEELRALGIDTVSLWGAEYWQFRRVRYHDDAWWNEVCRLLRQEHPEYILQEVHLESPAGEPHHPTHQLPILAPPAH